MEIDIMIPDMSQVKIGDIKAATENVDVRVKVLSLNQRELHNQRGRLDILLWNSW
ncbi:hypothetical protein [Thermogymnomonas acidicola]|uniref:hypothetical protein n=1 Tax=Thermogymnomonas acidicola TaxID=399579 RepID=UPI001493F2AD|nr:hypothetical protein [Thermogymnomonas acidicola]